MSELSFAAASCKLGRSIYKARVRAFDLACVDWDDLDPQTRHFFVTQAGDILKANKPPSLHDSPSPLFDAFANHTRRHFQVVK